MPFVRRLYLPLLLLLIFFYAFRPLEGGDDFWAHAAIGRIVLDTGHIPRHTVYLWSAQVPWVFQEWGAGTLYALLLRLGGPTLCLGLNFLLAATPFVLVWRRARQLAGEVPSLLVVLLVGAVIFSQARWHLRPEAFTVLFLTILLLFLTGKKPKWAYFAIAGMFAVWPNFHAGVAVGVLTLWGSALVSLFQTAPLALSSGPLTEPVAPIDAGQVPAAKWPLFALAGACSIIPLLCNPWGLGYISVFQGTQATANHIAEWRHFWAFPPMDRKLSWGLCVLWCVTFLVWLDDAKRRAPTLVALLLMGALWLQARRQLWLTSATCAFALAQSAPILRGDFLYRALKRGRRSSPDAPIAAPTHAAWVSSATVPLAEPMQLIGGIGTLLVLVAACWMASKELPHKWQAVSPAAPVAMSRFLLTQAPQGRLFNDYEYSAALEWYLGDKRDIYIDLINAYPASLFDEWFEVAHATPRGLKVLDTKRIDVIALRPIPAGNPDDPILSLARHLDKAKDWKLIYSGMDGRVWARKKPFQKP